MADCEELPEASHINAAISEPQMSKDLMTLFGLNPVSLMSAVESQRQLEL